jgi:hypothetical protein
MKTFHGHSFRLLPFQPHSGLVLALAIQASIAAADPSSTSPYRTDAQNSYVEDETSRGIGQVNMITCIMSSMRPDALVNQGAYNALVDETKCDPSARSSSDAVQGAVYMNAVVDATRTSNNDPMISKIWIGQDEQGEEMTIFVRVAATQAPSAANPYGLFRLDYCGKGEGMSSCLMNGYLQGAETGVRYFENEQGENGLSTKALQLNATGTTAGTGRLQMNHENGEDAFNFAYNANLFRRSDGTNDQCFSRDASDPDTGFSVWRYGLYDATTGARVTRNSGFPIEYTNAGTTYHGYLGYHGLSLPGEAMDAMASGSTVQKVDYSAGQSPVKTGYTVVKAAGKLLKYTRHTRTLQSIDKIKFSTFIGNNAAAFFAGAQPNTQYEMYWDHASGGFKVSGQMGCDQNGCRSSALPSEQSVPVAFWQTMGGVQGWSQSLGGELFINLNGAIGSVNAALIEVAYRTQDLVYPSQLPASLYCLRDCPTANTISAFFSPGASSNSPFAPATYNNWNPTQAADVVTYHTSADSALLLDGANQPVTFTNREALEQAPQYRHGLRTGRLFTTLAAAECANGSGTYCDYKVNQLDVYYQWETGSQPHNQFAAVKDAAGSFVAFDAPLNVSFDVPNTAAYGEYAGQSLVLQYGGFGDLWGIPGQCVSRSTNAIVDCSDENSRYVAAFVIPYDTAVGKVAGESGNYLVKWLEREIRFARKDAGVCSAAGLTLPSGIVLPTAADLKDPSNASSDVYIGTKPTVTAAPRVIHGDVKF